MPSRQILWGKEGLSWADGEQTDHPGAFPQSRTSRRGPSSRRGGTRGRASLPTQFSAARPGRLCFQSLGTCPAQSPAISADGSAVLPAAQAASLGVIPASSASLTPSVQPGRISCWLCLQNTSEVQIFLTTSTATTPARPRSPLPWAAARGSGPSSLPPCVPPPPAPRAPLGT